VALIENGDFGRVSQGALASVLEGFARRRDERRLKAALVGKPERLLRDMGLDPSAVTAGSWAYQLGNVQAIGNRP
jgi:hypothetical protein